MNVEAPPKKYHQFDRYDRKATTHLIELTPNRLDKLEAYFTHGFLSSEMVHALLEPTKRQNYTTDELKHLKRIPNNYLIQPSDQSDTLDARSKHLTYKISPTGVSALVDKGRITLADALLWKKLQQNNGPYWHDAAASYVTASIAFGAKEHGMRYIPWYEILNHKYCNTKDTPNPIEITYTFRGRPKAFVPDRIFGLARPGQRPIFYALEMDMGTEQHKESDLKHSTLTTKYKAYRHMWAHELHTEQYGVSEMHLLMVTTKALRLENIKEEFAKIAKSDDYKGMGPVHYHAVLQLDRHYNQKPPATGHLFAITQ